MERELIVEQTLAGLEAARRQGRVGGRKRLMTDRKLNPAKKLLGSGTPLRKLLKPLDFQCQPFTVACPHFRELELLFQSILKIKPSGVIFVRIVLTVEFVEGQLTHDSAIHCIHIRDSKSCSKPRIAVSVRDRSDPVFGTKGSHFREK